MNLFTPNYEYETILHVDVHAPIRYVQVVWRTSFPMKYYEFGREEVTRVKVQVYNVWSVARNFVGKCIGVGWSGRGYIRKCIFDKVPGYMYISKMCFQFLEWVTYSNFPLHIFAFKVGS